MNKKGIRRFYIRPENFSSITNDKTCLSILPFSEVHHISNVLRLGTGDEILLLDGEGNMARCAIKRKEKAGLFLKILSRNTLRDDRLPICLITAIIKGDRMNWLIQKASELGVMSISPIFTSQTVINPRIDRQEKRIERWEKISIQALKQSRGNMATRIHPPSSLEDAVSDCPSEGTKIFLSETEGKDHIFSVCMTQKRKLPATLIIGPEGGFSEKEMTFLKGHGFHPASLGKRILRSETAAIAGISILSACLEHLNRTS